MLQLAAKLKSDNPTSSGGATFLQCAKESSPVELASICEENKRLKKQLEIMAIEKKHVKDDVETNNGKGLIQMLAIKSEERDAFAAECSQLRKEVEDIKVNIEHFAENVTGLSMKGKAIAEMIDFVKSRYFEGREHRKGPESELEQGGGQQSRNHCYMVESRKSPDGTANDLQSEVKQNRKKINDLAMKNDELYSLNEKLVRENTEFQQINKNPREDIEGVEKSIAIDMEHITSFNETSKSTSGVTEDDAGKTIYTSDVECDILDDKISKLMNVCAGLKASLEVSRQELSQWHEIGELVNAKYEEKRPGHESNALDKGNIKSKLITLFDESQRLKSTENLVKQQFQDNQDVRKRLAAVTTKNNEMNKQISKLALRERQFYELKTKLSKACNGRNVLQRDVRQLTERLAQYEGCYKNYQEAIRVYEQFRFQYESICADNTKLKKLVEEHTEMLQLLQNENDMLRNKNERMHKLKGHEEQENSETNCFKQNILSLEDGFREEAKELQSQTF